MRAGEAEFKHRLFIASHLSGVSRAGKDLEGSVVRPLPHRPRQPLRGSDSQHCSSRRASVSSPGTSGDTCPHHPSAAWATLGSWSRGSMSGSQVVRGCLDWGAIPMRASGASGAGIRAFLGLHRKPGNELALKTLLGVCSQARVTPHPG